MVEVKYFVDENNYKSERVINDVVNELPILTKKYNDLNIIINVGKGIINEGDTLSYLIDQSNKISNNNVKVIIKKM